MSPHAIANLRVPAIAETVSVSDRLEEEQEDHEMDDNEVELANSSSVVPPNKLNKPTDFNVLIPEIELFEFISKNFNCKKCSHHVLPRKLYNERIGCASNLFWSCTNRQCDGKAKILAKQSTKEASGTFRKKTRSYLGTLLITTSTGKLFLPVNNPAAELGWRLRLLDLCPYLDVPSGTNASHKWKSSLEKNKLVLGKKLLKTICKKKLSKVP
jgi:hypothetical protein